MTRNHPMGIRGGKKKERKESNKQKPAIGRQRRRAAEFVTAGSGVGSVPDPVAGLGAGDPRTGCLLARRLVWWLTRWLVWWLTRWLAWWLPGCLTGWLAWWLTRWLVWCLARQLVWWLTRWLAWWLPGCLTRWLACWLTM